MKNNYQFLRLKQVRDMTCLSKSSIYRLVEEGDFPRQVPLGARSVVWVKSQVEYWMSKKLPLPKTVAHNETLGTSRTPWRSLETAG